LIDIFWKPKVSVDPAAKTLDELLLRSPESLKQAGKKITPRKKTIWPGFKKFSVLNDKEHK
jgi:hypothetical protein